MMTIAIVIGSVLVPVAHAVRLDQLGESNPAIANMWLIIKSTLPFSNVGLNAPALFGLKILSFITSLLTIGAAFMVIYGGLRMIVNGEEGYTHGKKIITYALVGLVLGMLATSIINYVAAEVANELFNPYIAP